MLNSEVMYKYISYTFNMYMGDSLRGTKCVQCVTNFEAKNSLEEI